MTTTPNYHLSQWVESDHIMMEDFNSDNLKLDTAIKGVADSVTAEVGNRQSADSALQTTLNQRIDAVAQGAKLFKLGQSTTSSDGQAMTIHLSSADMSQYAAMFLLVQAYIDANGVRDLTAKLNGTNLCTVLDGQDTQGAGITWILPVGAGKVHAVSIYHGYSHDGQDGGSAAVAWNSINSLSLSCSSGTVKAGASCILYGLKK